MAATMSSSHGALVSRAICRKLFVRPSQVHNSTLTSTKFNFLYFNFGSPSPCVQLCGPSSTCIITRFYSRGGRSVPNIRHVINRPMKPKEESVNELYENPELNIIPEREEYAEIWLQVKGYDFVPVEEYITFLHRFVISMDLPVEQIAIPPRSWTISTYKPNSTVEDHQYQLKKAHRVLKIYDVPNNILSLLSDMLTRHIPAGVELSVTLPDEDINEFRFVPDEDVKLLQQAIYDLENPRLKKRR